MTRHGRDVMREWLFFLLLLLVLCLSCLGCWFCGCRAESVFYDAGVEQIVRQRVPAAVVNGIGPDLTARAMGTACCTHWLQEHRQSKALSVGVLGDMTAPWAPVLQDMLQQLGWANAVVESCVSSAGNGGPAQLARRITREPMFCGCHDAYILAFRAADHLQLDGDRSVQGEIGQLRYAMADVIYAVWRKQPCAPEVLIWDGMPDRANAAATYINEYEAHLGAARDNSVGHVSLYAAFFHRNAADNPPPAIPPEDAAARTTIVAAILADYIVSAPTSASNAPKKALAASATVRREQQKKQQQHGASPQTMGVARCRNLVVAPQNTSEVTVVAVEAEQRNQRWVLRMEHKAHGLLSFDLPKPGALDLRLAYMALHNGEHSFEVQCSRYGDGSSGPNRTISRVVHNHLFERQGPGNAAPTTRVVAVCADAEPVRRISIAAVNGTTAIAGLSFHHCDSPPVLAASDAQAAAGSWTSHVFKDERLPAIMLEFAEANAVRSGPAMRASVASMLRRAGRDVTARATGVGCCNRFLAPYRAGKKISIATVGGSVTLGTGCTMKKLSGSGSTRCSWPLFLQEFLRKLGWEHTSVRNCAQSGTRPPFATMRVASNRCGCEDLYIIAYSANTNGDFWPLTGNDAAAYDAAFTANTQDIATLIHTIWNMDCGGRRPDILIFDEMPPRTHRKFLDSPQTARPFWINSILADMQSARENRIPHISMLSAFYADYVRANGDAPYFKTDDVHQSFKEYSLFAAMVADYLLHAPLTSTDPPKEHLLANDPLVCKSGQYSMFTAAKPKERIVSVSGEHFTYEADTHARKNWFVWNHTSSFIQFDFATTVSVVAVHYMRSYSEEWGEMAVECLVAHSEEAGRSNVIVGRLQSRHAQPNSLFYTASVCTTADALRLRAVRGKNQVYAISFCSHKPMDPRPQT